MTTSHPTAPGEVSHIGAQPFCGTARRLTLIVLAFLPMVATSAEESLRAALRDQAFAPANEALEAANQAAAAVLAPETYRAGSVAYRRAEAAFAEGAELKRVRPYLEEATAKFTQAADTATTVRPFVKDAYEARLDALGADARSRAEDLWKKAELEFYEATSRAEQGRESRIERYATKAEALYREAELAAIETALFTEIETEITAARRLDADDWAPVSYESAIALLAQAREELTSNRYDTDKPRDLANQALHHARHAQYVARLADDIDDNDNSLEAVLLEWERGLMGLAADLDRPIYFDNGPQDAIMQLREAVADAEGLRAAMDQALADTRTRAQILEEELNQLQTDLQGQEAAKARLNERLAAQERQAEKIRRIENLFAPEEAQVVRARNQVIIRLVGLSFSSGSARLEPRHDPVLAKLKDALAEFPEVPITIEGHTDSYGVDTNNQRLSVERAEAVSRYLLDNLPISALQLSAVGYGETQPIANNETAQGRAQNRRIDVVLYP